MVDGSLRSIAEPGAPQWDVVVGDRFIVALAAPASEDMMAGLADLAAEPEPALERIVSRIPTGHPGAVESFAVVWWPGAGTDEVTAIVRGNAVVDLASPGGTRRFDSRGIRPFHLAEFGDVVAVRATGSDAGLWSAARAGLEGTDVGRPRATFRASAVTWSARPPGARSAAAPAGARESAGGRVPLDEPTPLDEVAAAASPAPSVLDALADTVVSPRNRSADADTVRSARNRTAEADTVLSRRRRPARPGTAADGSESEPAPDAQDDTQAAEQDDATQVAIRGALRRAPAAPIASSGASDAAAVAPRFRIGTGSPRSVVAPVRIGRNPAPPRISPAGAELVRVDSPTSVISSTHLELRREGRRLVAIDLRSTNGTVVHAPSGTRRMRSGESLVVVPGTSLDLGDDTIIEILPAPEGAEE